MDYDIKKNNNSESLKTQLINGIEKRNIANAIEQVKTEKFQKIVHNIYVTISILIIFVSLFFLNYNRFLFSIYIVLSITLLHFKFYILDFIYELINIHT